MPKMTSGGIFLQNACSGVSSSSKFKLLSVVIPVNELSELPLAYARSFLL